MRAWRVKEAGEPRAVLSLEEVESPAVSPGMLKVRVLAAGVGLPDVLMCRGSYPLTPPYPFTPGQELVGEIMEVGEGAPGRVGDRVMGVSGFYLGHGSFAEECLAQGDFSLPVPDQMSPEEAASFVIPYHTAWTGLARRARLAPGETLLVLGGAGGTGSAAVQLGKAMGARVLATAGGSGKVAFCRALGADEVIDYRAQDIVEGVREATDGRGVDVAFDTVGGSTFEAASRVMAIEGRLLLIGFACGEWGRPSAGHMVNGNYSVMGVLPSFYDHGVREKAHEELIGHWRDGHLSVPIHRAVPFEATADGVGELALGGVMGKIAVRIEPGAKDED